MQLAYFDCSYGVAGDMILGALVDAGAPFAQLKREIEKGIGVEGIRLTRTRVERAGIVGTRVLVKIDHSHDHHRHLADIEKIVAGSSFAPPIKERCVEIFRRLAEAEAKVHNTTIDKIHFHEVGCLDAIADVAGSVLAFDMLKIDRVEASPLTVGSGTTRCAHGILPVPGPATVELLRGVPFHAGQFAMEMTTPTGAAVLTTFAQKFGPQPLLALERVGYGAGKREIEGHANFLRVLIGKSSEAHPVKAAPESAEFHTTRLNLLMTEIDDMTPEMLGHLLERLFQAGCLDAHFTPIQMKKNRPATQLQVLCRAEQKIAFAELILRHSSTFGLKVLEIDRLCLPRRAETIKTALGPLDVKIGFWGSEILKVTPEYESCRRLAEASGLPLMEVYRRSEAEIANRYFVAGPKTARKKRS